MSAKNDKSFAKYTIDNGSVGFTILNARALFNTHRHTAHAFSTL